MVKTSGECPRARAYRSDASREDLSDERNAAEIRRPVVSSSYTGRPDVIELADCPDRYPER